jgi:hypothetical protein
MAIRIPSNITVKSQYTAGKQYMYESTQREYQGYYYEMNGKIFAGKEFNSNAPTLLKITPNNINSLLATAATYVYGKITGTKLPSNTQPPSFLFQYDSETRYYSYQINKKLIKEIDKNTFNTFKLNPLYKVISLSYKDGFNKTELEKVEKDIPGITTFVESSYTNPQIEDDGLVG